MSKLLRMPGRQPSAFDHIEDSDFVENAEIALRPRDTESSASAWENESDEGLDLLVAAAIAQRAKPQRFRGLNLPRQMFEDLGFAVSPSPGGWFDCVDDWHRDVVGSDYRALAEQIREHLRKQPSAWIKVSKSEGKERVKSVVACDRCGLPETAHQWIRALFSKA